VGILEFLFPKNLSDFVIAGFAAGQAVHQAVGTDAYINLRLAHRAELLAFTAFFSHFTLYAAGFCFSGRGHIEAL
jgi:hypothetical protein